MLTAFKAAFLTWIKRETKDYALVARVEEIETKLRSIFNTLECAREGHRPMKLPPGMRGIFDFYRTENPGTEHERKVPIAKTYFCARCKVVYWQEVEQEQAFTVGRLEKLVTAAAEADDEGVSPATLSAL